MNYKYQAKAVAIASSVLLLTASITPTALAAGELTRVAVEDVNLFHVNYSADTLTLTAKNDEEVAEPETLELTVPETAKSQNPTTFSGIEKEAYLLPIFSDDFITHAGEDSDTRFPNTGLRFTKVAGPGKIYLGTGQNDKTFTPVLNTKAPEITKDSVLPANVFGDNMAHLIFDTPGKYKFQVEAIEVNTPANLTENPVSPANVTRTSPSKVYTFLVGTAGLNDQTDPFANSEDTAAPSDSPTNSDVPGDPMTNGSGGNSADSNPDETNDQGNETTPGGENAPNNPKDKDQPDNASGNNGDAQTNPNTEYNTESTDKTAGSQPKQQLPAPNAAVNNSGVANTLGKAISNLLASPTCFASFEGGEGTLAIVPKVKDDRVSPSKWYKFNEISFTIGDAGIAKLPAAIGGIPAGSKVWMIGSTQQSGVPWVGANTMSDTVMQETTGEVTWTLASFSGPGAMEVFTSGNFGTLVGEKWFSANGNSGSGSVTIPKNTHVHPNWVFSAPGIYRVGITQTATLKNGTKVSATDTLFFQVGAGNGAREGHFDIGSEIAKVGAKRVWKDANGNPCNPGETDLRNAVLTNLANTGYNSLTFPMLILACGIGVFGLGLRMRPRAEA